VYIPDVVCCGSWGVAHLRANLLPPPGRCAQHGDSIMLRSRSVAAEMQRIRFVFGWYWRHAMLRVRLSVP